MGRSVLEHPDAVVTAYASWSDDHVSLCTWCDEEVTRDYPDWVVEGADVPTYCDAHMTALLEEHDGPYEGIEADATHEGWDYDEDNFQNDVGWVTEYMQELWPSLYPVDRWVGREVHVVLENRLVEVSVSEYCGLVALCIAPRSDLSDYGDNTRGLGIRWAESVSERFRRTFGSYAKLGTFSNGESVYVSREE